RLAELMPFLSLSRPVLTSGVIQTKNHILIRMEEIMKTNRTFKTGISILSVSSVLLVLSFGLFQFTIMPPLVAFEEEQKILTDVLTLEMTIGGEDDPHKDEFLLVSPKLMDVSYEGDILIPDEGKIKVYDDKGNEKTIIGRIGQGPAEFKLLHSPFLSPTGYLIVADVSGRKWSSFHYSGDSKLVHSYNLFSPDYSFIEKRRFDNSLRIDDYLKTKNVSRGNVKYIRRIYALSEYEKVYEIEIVLGSLLLSRLPFFNAPSSIVILYENAETVIPLVETRFIASPNDYNSYFELGQLHWELMPDRRIMYLNTDEDIYNIQTGSFYTVHTLSLDGLEDKKITRQFSTIEFPESKTNREEYSKNESFRQREEREVKAYREKKYYASVDWVKIDGNYAFMFTYTQNDKEEILTDVFDLKAGKYITSVYFPFVPIVIRDGYAYYLQWSGGYTFAEVRKYKIDPAVYGK
ncbi:hypothetical protein AMJ80_06760, partial [bacterium SM23_31]